MTTNFILCLTVVFGAVFGFSMLLFQWLAPGTAQRRLKRLSSASDEVPDQPESGWVVRVAQASGTLARLSRPEDGTRMSSMRTHFMQAGLRGQHASILFFAGKTVLAVTLPALVLLVAGGFRSDLNGNTLLLCAFTAAAAGYYFPNLILRALIRRRQREIFESFPDALDLMTVCIEAGLSADAAISRVAQEMAMASPAAAEELYLVTLEMRAGQSKEQALRNLAARTGVADVDTLATMLIQAERFGTSITDSLRVHSDHLRTQRRQQAEERAAKVALKLLMPLIFCIFPALILIMLGPSFIQIGHVLMPSIAAQ